MTRSAMLRLVILGTVWGMSFLFIKVALEGLTPLQVALGRTLAGAAVVWLIVAVKRLPVPRDPSLWRRVAALSLVANVIPFYAFAWAGERISSGVAGVYNATTPLMTLVIAIVFLPEERPSRERVVGLVLGFIGVVVVLGPWRGVDQANSITGQFAALGAAVSYGIGFNVTRKKLAGTGLPPLVLAACQLTAAAVVLGVITPVVSRDPVELTPRVVLSMLALGGLGTGIAFALYHGLIRDIGATSASMVTFVIPLVAVTLGVAVLDEPLGWNLFAGGAVVIIAVALAEGRLHRRAPVTPSASAATTDVVTVPTR